MEKVRASDSQHVYTTIHKMAAAIAAIACFAVFAALLNASPRPWAIFITTVVMIALVVGVWSSLLTTESGTGRHKAA